MKSHRSSTPLELMEPHMHAIDTLKRMPLTLLLTVVALLLHVTTVLESYVSLDLQTFTLWDLPRIVTCHWLHWSAEHLLWDLAVFAGLGAICEWQWPRQFAGTLILSALAIPLCIMWWQPQIDSYRGLSGIDTALFGLLVGKLLIQKIDEREGTAVVVFCLLLAGLFGKISLELLSHRNLFVSDTSFTPVPLAHLVGALIGLMVAALDRRSQRNVAECRLLTTGE